MLVNALNIKLVMTSDGNGEIAKTSQARGMKKAIQKMAEAIKEDAVDPENRTLFISYCNNKERAEFVKDAILSVLPFKDVLIAPTGGVSSLYAADGGIVVCYWKEFATKESLFSLVEFFYDKILKLKNLNKKCKSKKDLHFYSLC